MATMQLQGMEVPLQMPNQAMQPSMAGPGAIGQAHPALQPPQQQPPPYQPGAPVQPNYPAALEQQQQQMNHPNPMMNAGQQQFPQMPGGQQQGLPVGPQQNRANMAVPACLQQLLYVLWSRISPQQQAKVVSILKQHPQLMTAVIKQRQQQQQQQQQQGQSNNPAALELYSVQQQQQQMNHPNPMMNEVALNRRLRF